MVQVGMGQQDCINSIGRHLERLPVPAQEIPFLVKAAVNQEPCVVSFQKIAGAGYILRRSQETEV